ncbi:hypothetical protein QTN25_007945 [Entamoeba marina]
MNRNNRYNRNNEKVYSRIKKEKQSTDESTVVNIFGLETESTTEIQQFGETTQNDTTYEQNNEQNNELDKYRYHEESTELSEIDFNQKQSKNKAIKKEKTTAPKKPFDAMAKIRSMKALQNSKNSFKQELMNSQSDQEEIENEILTQIINTQTIHGDVNSVAFVKQQIRPFQMKLSFVTRTIRDE